MIFIKLKRFENFSRYIVKSVSRKEKEGLSYYIVNEKNEFSNSIDEENKFCYFFIETYAGKKTFKLETKLESFNFIRINDYYEKISAKAYNSKFELVRCNQKK